MTSHKDEYTDAWQCVLQLLLGREFLVFSDRSGGTPRVDILAFRPSPDRDFWSLVTSGLSRLPMLDADGETLPRVELVIYAEEPAPDLIELLTWVALRIRDDGHWLSVGSTLTSGDPNASFVDNCKLSCLAFLQPLTEPDFAVPALHTVDGEPVFLLWTLPISAAERAFLMTHEVVEFYDLLETRHHAISFTTPRNSYVEP